MGRTLGTVWGPVRKAVFAGLVGLLATHPAAAQDRGESSSNMAVAGTAGSMGVGLDMSVKLSDGISMRLPLRYMQIDVDGDLAGISYETELTVGGIGLVGDYHPFGGGLRLSGGLFYNLMDASLSANPSSPVSIGGVSYLADQIGTISVDVDYRNFAPYLGVGYGGPIGRDRGLQFFADVGVLWVGDPDIDMSVSDPPEPPAIPVLPVPGPPYPGPVPPSNILSEKDDIKQDLPEFYPVVQIGMTYRF